MERIVNRLKEPSTYAGLMGIAVVLGVTTEGFDMYVNAAAGVFAFVSIILKEVGAEK